MDLSSKEKIKTILNEYGAKPQKGLGQNFLIDKNILSNILEASDIQNNDTVLEVGPGLGVLTQELAKKARKVIAVEKDKKMAEILRKNLADFKNIEIIEDDILKLNPKRYTLNAYKVVANIPYYITSPLIRKFLEAKFPPKDLVLMVQKEVAQRICASPPKMSLLAVSVQFYAQAKIAFYVSKNCFWPAPKVDSAIIKIVPHKIVGHRESYNLFFAVVKAGFSHPRKQLAGNLSHELKLTKEQTIEWLAKSKINQKQRAETLSVEDWTRLVDNLIILIPQKEL